MAHFRTVIVASLSGVLLSSFSVPGPIVPEVAWRLAAQICGPVGGRSALRRALEIARAETAPAHDGAAIPLYPDLATSPFSITTDHARARQFFSQGLMLTYGFNHAGAVRSFRMAQGIDPNCAMCWWGEAVALGPNINAPMDDRDRPAALHATERAMALRAHATPAERALIEAVALRYTRDATADRAALDSAYADAMLAVARRFPADNDIAVLAAEAVMDTTPWNYWEADKRTPIGRIGTAIALVEAVLQRAPTHEQAAHLYIHLLEASNPARAEAAADRLTRSPAVSAGHLVHMPGHIYVRRGRYADAMRVNVAALRADETFIQATGDAGLVRYGYYPHNLHFIVASAQLAGDMDTAIREARRLRTILDPATSAKIAWVQVIDAAPYLALAQFADAETILAAPEPDARLPYAGAMRHYARAVAYAQRRDQRKFDAEIAALSQLQHSDRFADMIAQGVPAPDLLALAQSVARGRRAMTQGDYRAAAEHYRAAISIEDRLPYQEPSFWYAPVRQSLGAALFQARQYDAAADAFRAALVQTPNNGWALYGLMRSDTARGRSDDAATARTALDRAWLGDQRWLRMDRL
jgi:tetratricopeptide (TPR) repeat protein